MNPPPRPPHSGDEIDLAVAPVSSKVRSDVDRFGAFMRQIRTGYLKVGVLLMLTTGLTGTVVALTGSFSDWYMHLGMYLVLTIFGLLYIRAHLRRFRILEVFWFILFSALLVGFSWILIDLVPARLDVFSDRLRPDGLIGPEVGLRPEAPLLWLPVVLLWAQVLWLVLHKALVAPAARRAHR